MIARARELYAAVGWRGFVLTGAAALALSWLIAFSTPTLMFVDGERVDSDVAPVTTANAKVFVPLRSVADALGAETEVEGKSGKIDVTLGGQSLEVRVGDTRARVNGMPLTLKHAPFRVRGRVLISLEAMAHALNVHANYDPRTSRIEVTTPGIGQAP